MRRLFNQIAAVIITLTIVIIVCISVASAQSETSQLTGIVSDVSGAVISDAKVMISSTDTGAERQTISNEQGIYTVTNLKPGSYQITVEMPGFIPKIVKVQLPIAARVEVDIQLSIRAETDMIVITGNIPTVNTESSELSDNFSEKQLRQLPNMDRTPYGTAVLTGNLLPDTSSTQLEFSPSRENSGGGVLPSSNISSIGYLINGQPGSTNVLLDGGDNNNFTGGVALNVPLDAVQELRIITSNISADYGRTGSGVINIITKSGSNQFHGTLYEFNRVARLSTRLLGDYDDHAAFTRNQFGYSVGGPIIKDRVFFFSSGEFVRVRSTALQDFLVPSQELLSIAAPATARFFENHRLLGLPEDIIRKADFVRALPGLDPNSPLARLPGAFPLFVETDVNVPTDVGASSPQNTFLFLNRLDWNATKEMVVYARYGIERSRLFDGSLFSSPYQGFNSGTKLFNNSALVSITNAFSPRLVGQFKLAFSRNYLSQQPAEQPIGTRLFADPALHLSLPGYNPSSIFASPLQFFNPTEVLSDQAFPFNGAENIFQINQDISYNLGAHQLRFGGSYIHIQDNILSGIFANSVQFLGNGGEAINNLLTGRVKEFVVAVDPQGKYPGETVQLPLNPPNFRSDNRFNEYFLYLSDIWRATSTLTLNFGLRYEYFGVQHNRDAARDANFYYGDGAIFSEQIKNGKVLLAQQSSAGGLYRKDKNNFAPRVGFAWDIFHDGKTSLRGGCGLSYLRLPVESTFDVIENPPNFALLTLSAADYPNLKISTNNLGMFAGSGEVKLPKSNLTNIDENIRNGYVTFYSLSLERQLVNGTIISMEYAGSQGKDLYTMENINNSIENQLINQQYNSINSISNAGSLVYNAATIGLQSNNFANIGLLLTAKYTLSHASFNFRDRVSNLSYTFEPNYDRRFRFITSGIWEIPFGRELIGLKKQLLNGWLLSSIYTVIGTPNRDQLDTGYIRQLDLVMAKLIRINDQFNLQLRVEGFNILRDHSQRLNPLLEFQPNLPISTNGRRQIQIAIKLLF